MGVDLVLSEATVQSILLGGFLGFVAGFMTAWIIMRNKRKNPEAQKQVHQVNIVFLAAAGVYAFSPLLGLPEARSEVLIFILALAGGDAVGGVATRILKRYGVKSDGSGKEKKR